MDVSTALVAHSQPAELVQPAQGPLHHPAVHSQPAAVFRASRARTARCGACAIPGAAAASHRSGQRTAAGGGRAAGTASTSGNNWVTSWRLAPVTIAERGVPLASVST